MNQEGGIYIKIAQRKESVKKEVNELTCPECGIPCKNKLGLISHSRSHKK